MAKDKKFYDLNGEKVYFEIDDYQTNPMVMAIQAYTEDDEPYATLSLNLGHFTGNNSFIRPNCTFIDTNNVYGVEMFLDSVGAEPYTRFGCPVIAQSGFCAYPLYEFPEKLLREMDSDGYEKHLAKYNEIFPQEQRKLNIAMFGFDPNDMEDMETDSEEDLSINQQC